MRVTQMSRFFVALLLSVFAMVAAGSDLDGDGLLAGVDNCPVAANPDQADYDLDGMGDVCDIVLGWEGPIGAIGGEVYKKLFGGAVGFVGDLNGDGRDEIIVGAPLGDRPVKDANGNTVKTIRGAGMVQVISPAYNNAVLYEFYGDRPKDAFGAAVLGVGDISHDGVPDFVVGAPGADVTTKPVRSGAGRVVAYSGADGSVLFDVYGGAAGDALGFSLAALGDYDGSGVADVLAGAPLSSPVLGGTTKKLKKAGKVQILAGEDGDVLRTVKGAVAGGQLGFSVTGMRDLNADGKIDFAAGAPFQTVNYLDPNNRPTKALGAGAVAIFSGLDGKEIGRLEVPGAGIAYPMPNSRFGWSLADMGDQDGDGVGDIAVGAPDALGDIGAGFTEKGAGVVKVMSLGGFLLAKGSLNVGGAHFGYAVANGGDIDGDGLDDLLIGVPFESTTATQNTTDGGLVVVGRALWESGVIDQFGGVNESSFPPHEQAAGMRNLFGAAVAGRGSLTGKGAADVIIGAPNAGGRYGGVFLWRHAPSR